MADGVQWLSQSDYSILSMNLIVDQNFILSPHPRHGLCANETALNAMEVCKVFYAEFTSFVHLLSHSRKQTELGQ